MIYGYVRVSTTAQSLGQQLEQFKQVGVFEENMYKEKFIGMKINCSEFTKLLSILKDNDTVVVTKLERFTMNTKEALEVIEPLLERNITIKNLNLGTIENTSIGRMLMRTILSVAEM